MIFKIIKMGAYRDSFVRETTVFLKEDNWDDFSFKTLFELSVKEPDKEIIDIGSVKIGYSNQAENFRTVEEIFKIHPSGLFSELGSEFFSLGQSLEFYQGIYDLSQDIKIFILEGLNDVAFNRQVLSTVEQESVFKTSLLRNIPYSLIAGQFLNVLRGNAALTPFSFEFNRKETKNLGKIDLTFDVKVGTSPPTNIHALIGRNGVGKTTLFRGIIDAVLNKNEENELYLRDEVWGRRIGSLPNNYFSTLVSVAFSAFDPFEPLKEQVDPTKGTTCHYIGLKSEDNNIMELSELWDKCYDTFIYCLKDLNRKKLLLQVIEKLGSDENFHDMKLGQLINAYPDKGFSVEDNKLIRRYFDRFSSGHAITFITITHLVAKTNEKTLVLIDEPESHLHPPLLSAFIRALSDILITKNAVAIIATHSPVVLQEISKKCVWKIIRSGKVSIAERPTIETFAENVGTLTSEIFGLEVAKSGFHDLLQNLINQGKSYDDILSDFDGQIGAEGRILLKVMEAMSNKQED